MKLSDSPKFKMTRTTKILGTTANGNGNVSKSATPKPKPRPDIPDSDTVKRMLAIRNITNNCAQDEENKGRRGKQGGANANDDDDDEEEEEEEEEEEAKVQKKEEEEEDEESEREIDQELEIKKEIEDFMLTFKDSRYKIIQKIGQGTFSSVYVAQDLDHYKYDNSGWCWDHQPPPTTSTTTTTTTSHHQSKRRTSSDNNDNDNDDHDMMDEGADSSSSASGAFESACGKVALKRIYATSSAVRIHTELSLLRKLRGHPHIAGLITALRYEDQVVAVLPFFYHDNFKYYYKKLIIPLEFEEDAISMASKVNSLNAVSRDDDNYLPGPRKQIPLQNYLFCLLSALHWVQKCGFMHRDVKPSNFLYNFKLKRGILIDFGLAQPKPSDKDILAERHASGMRGSIPYYNIGGKGYMVNEQRPSIRASRAGTRGFRAPEVLFKVTAQTPAIDIWSVGVTMLCILSQQFPFFQSNDDVDALLEIAHIYGLQKMRRIATKFDRTFETNIPSIAETIPFELILKKKNPAVLQVLGVDGYRMLQGLLELDPFERFSAHKAINHSFLAVEKRKHVALHGNNWE